MLHKFLGSVAITFVATAVVAFGWCAYQNLNGRPDEAALSAEQSGIPADSPRQTQLRCTVPVLIENERDVVSGSFQIHNHFARPVELTIVRKSCACAEARLDRKHLEPGETTTLQMTVRLIGKSGKNRIDCYLEEPDGHSWHCQLEVTIYSEARFASSPLHFGNVEPGKLYERELILELASRKREDLNDVELITHADAVNILSRDERIEQSHDGIYLKKIHAQVGLKAPEGRGLGSALLSATCRRNSVIANRVDLTCAWSVPE